MHVQFPLQPMRARAQHIEKVVVYYSLSEQFEQKEYMHILPMLDLDNLWIPVSPSHQLLAAVSMLDVSFS